MLHVVEVYFSGEEDGHECGVCFLVHKDLLISNRLRTAPFRSSSEIYQTANSVKIMV